MVEYIDRKALIKSRHGCDQKCAECDFAQEGDSWCKGELFVVDVLRQPAADVKPVVRGKWIVKYPLVTCSVCCNTFDIVGLLNFCPNCGADMREQEPKQEPAGPYDLLHEEGGWNLQ